MDVQVYHRENFQCWIENGIVYVYYMHGCIVTLAFAKEIIKLRLNAQQGIEYPGIAIVDDSVVMNPDARKYLASIEGYAGVTKVALITTSKLKTILANMFIMIDKPFKPTRLFTDKAEALKWLRK